MKRPKNPDRADPIMFTQHGPHELPSLRQELNSHRTKVGMPALHDDKPIFIKSCGYASEVFHTPEDAERHAMKQYGRHAQVSVVRPRERR
jgi:hypothetical protein